MTVIVQFLAPLVAVLASSLALLVSTNTKIGQQVNGKTESLPHPKVHVNEVNHQKEDNRASLRIQNKTKLGKAELSAVKVACDKKTSHCAAEVSQVQIDLGLALEDGNQQAPQVAQGV